MWALENGDPRTGSWFLVHSPLPVTLLLAVYLLLVVAGPRLMGASESGRTPRCLQPGPGGSLGYMFYEFTATSLLANYSYLCQPVDYSWSKLGMRMASVCWWCFSKAVELLDTTPECPSLVFFILRKKPEQITFLHVYHHGTMLFNWRAGVKHVSGGQAFFVGMLSSLVHVFMHLYYGLWHLTVLQLGQFVAIAAHSSYNLFAECPFPDGFNVAILLYLLSLLALFFNFYQQTYLRSKRKKPA
ncbi:hypothetical protein FD755_001675 [Muntiacus reevesi]|uniref:Elongation of very long chain fatty acids protein n=1 Tax=Muntiacus reevesi TaxID=9886 RepID=A0A5J5N552_MUNRE|nr:hypothetical protein FD755_001675 [Muntiacus reevesi]